MRPRVIGNIFSLFHLLKTHGIAACRELALEYYNVPQVVRVGSFEYSSRTTNLTGETGSGNSRSPK